METLTVIPELETIRTQPDTDFKNAWVPAFVYAQAGRFELIKPVRTASEYCNYKRELWKKYVDKKEGLIRRRKKPKTEKKDTYTLMLEQAGKEFTLAFDAIVHEFNRQLPEIIATSNLEAVIDYFNRVESLYSFHST